VQQQLATPSLPGVLYIGDAQGTIEPLAGQGITMALAGARLAAKLLLANDNRDARAALQRQYQREWLKQFTRPIRWGARFGWLLRRPQLLDSVLAMPVRLRALHSSVLRLGYRSTRLAALEPSA
jgi:flavin-dependent dehydrogenase